MHLSNGLSLQELVASITLVHRVNVEEVCVSVVNYYQVQLLVARIKQMVGGNVDRSYTKAYCYRTMRSLDASRATVFQTVDLSSMHQSKSVEYQFRL